MSFLFDGGDGEADEGDCEHSEALVVVVGNNDDCGGDEEGPGEAGDEVGDNADGEDNYPVPVFALEVKGGEVRVGYVLLLVWGVI